MENPFGPLIDQFKVSQSVTPDALQNLLRERGITCNCLITLVARGRIELPTRGFSVRQVKLNLLILL